MSKVEEIRERIHRFKYIGGEYICRDCGQVRSHLDGYIDEKHQDIQTLLTRISQLEKELEAKCKHCTRELIPSMEIRGTR